MLQIEATSAGSVNTNGDSLDNKVSDPLVSHETRRVIEIIFFNAISAAVSVVGIVASVINIIIFLKQGFKDSVNISFFGLTISDLGVLLTLLCMSVCRNPMLNSGDTEYSLAQVMYIVATVPHTSFVWTTCWITTYITLERCVCIALPMKVKVIITPTRTSIAIVSIFAAMFAGVSPAFFSYQIITMTNILRNTTFYGLKYFRDGIAIRRTAFDMNIFVILTSFVIMTVCTVILITNLKTKSQWRRKCNSLSSVSTSHSMSTRDRRAIRMVTTISIIFIVCYFPTNLNCLLIITFPKDYSIAGRYQNSYIASWAIMTPLQSLNSAATFLVYCTMSSQFQTRFKELIGRRMRLVTRQASN